MAVKNVDSVRALVALWNSGDRDFGAALKTYVDPEVELRSPFSTVSGRPYCGYAGIQQWMRDVDDQFVEWSIMLDDVADLGDRVLARATVLARARASEVPLRLPDAGSIWDFSPDGRARLIRIYPTAREALIVAGLEQ